MVVSCLYMVNMVNYIWLSMVIDGLYMVKDLYNVIHITVMTCHCIACANNNIINAVINYSIQYNKSLVFISFYSNP